MSNHEVVLRGDLRDHLDALDFSVIGYIPAQRLLDDHRRTRWHVARFGGGLPQRPQAPDPPDQPAQNEVVYLRKLLAAYTEHRGQPVDSVDDLVGANDLQPIKLILKSSGIAINLLLGQTLARSLANP